MLVATDVTPDNNFVYAFPHIDVTKASEVDAERKERGEKNQISAIGYTESDLPLAEDVIVTSGAPDHVKLTPVTGPDGLVADGSDVMYFDVEVVDEDGNICPLDYSRLNMSLSGNGVLLGGYNSGVGDKITTHNTEYTYAECGVNRIFVRSTREAGAITLTVGNTDLGNTTATIESIAFDNTVDGGTGLSTTMQRSYGLGAQPPIVEEKVEPFRSLAQAVQADFDETTGNTKVVEVVDNTVYYTFTV